jgi:polyhydroxybutyrate depolymerase
MRLRRDLIAVVAGLGLLFTACSSGTGNGSGGGPAAGSGGTSAAGGMTGSGGATVPVGSGGSSGGRSGSGGASASGGRSGSGGQPGSGGSAGATSGTVGPNGGTGGQGTGGTVGGATGMDAGRDARGSGGSMGIDARSGTGGVSNPGIDGAAGGTDGPAPTCSGTKTTSSCAKSGGTKCTLTSNSKPREYYLILPPSYSASKPYPMVIMLHGMIATAEMALSWFSGIPTDMPNAIYIAPQGLKHKETGGGANGQEVTGWANVDGEDIQFMRDLVSATEKDYCVDSQRVFAVGFSYGAMFSYAIGCELGGLFRAIAPMSGALLSGCNLSGKPIAMWGSHGTSDSLVAIASGRQARDKILGLDHCGTATTAIDPSPCVSYQGCDQGYPVTWCEWDGDHNRPPFGNSAVAAFFKQF